VPEVVFQDLFGAKIRQLEQFGLTQETPLSSATSGLAFSSPGKRKNSP
jgi:hypothetical protein